MKTKIQRKSINPSKNRMEGIFLASKLQEEKTHRFLFPLYKARGRFIALSFVIFLFSFLWKGIIPQTYANGVSITNVTLSGANISFNIAWSNSWNVTQSPGNNDAVWVFVKYATCVTGAAPVWLHAPLSNISSHHSTGAPASLIVQAVNDGMGVFVRRAITSYSTPAAIASTLVTLELNVPSDPSGYNYKVFGIEMVSIPQSSFYIGDGNASPVFTTRLISNSHESSGITANTLLATSPAVPAAYPVGFASFYCMKYEISQQQYVDFLNTLTYAQQASRTAIAPNTTAANNAGLNAYAMITGGTIGSYPNPTRNGIRISQSGVDNTQPAVYMCDLNGDGIPTTTAASTDGLNIACNYLSWADLGAYLDWAALRPMSEMEYEKVCRGADPVDINEYPWGLNCAQIAPNSNSCWTGAVCPLYYGYLSAGSTACTNPLSMTIYPSIDWANTTNITGSGLNSEASSNQGQNSYVGLAVVGGTGPMRVGLAARAASTRISAGAGYYGVLDLAGNVLERTISATVAGAGSPLAGGTSFVGDSLGDGTLDVNGNADVGTWPTWNTGTGTGFRGGSFLTTGATTLSTTANTYWRAYAYGGAVVGAGSLCNTVNGTYTINYLTRLRTSDRSDANLVNLTRVSDYGGRGVRTAP